MACVASLPLRPFSPLLEGVLIPHSHAVRGLRSTPGIGQRDGKAARNRAQEAGRAVLELRCVRASERPVSIPPAVPSRPRSSASACRDAASLRGVRACECGLELLRQVRWGLPPRSWPAVERPSVPLWGAVEDLQAFGEFR